MHSTSSDTRDFILMAGPDGPRLPAVPALDGLRGLAVAAVVLYHAEFTVMIGGYLGVSTFFTLSGFLITTLLINESARNGTVALREFWGRRFRRLMPASLATLALVSTLFAWLVATADQRATMPGDVLSSLFNVANWHFIREGASYGDLFVAPSPVLHFWSLAIEEQFYLIFPLVLVGLWKLTKARSRVLGLALGALAVCSISLPWIFTMSKDRIYFGTDTRAAELLLGAVLAVLLSRKPVRRKLALVPKWRVGLALLGAACLAVQVYWWWTLPQATDWLYKGGFALYATMSCVVIASLALPRSPLRAAFSVGWLRWLGLRSYGIYLAHWPIFLVVRQELPSWGRLAQAVLAISCSLAVAEISYRFLEQPVRLRRWPSRERSLAVAGSAMVVVALCALIPWPIDESARSTDFESALDDFNSRSAATASRPTTTQPPAAVPQPPAIANVDTFGDSTALLMAMGMGTAAAESGKQAGLVDDIGGDVELGCGVSRFDMLRVEFDSVVTDQCRSWPERWSQKVAANHPDIAQLITGAWEVPDVRLPGSTTWSSLGDPAVDEFVRSELTTAVDLLAADGAMVLLVLWPEYGQWAQEGKTEALQRQADPARMRRLHELMREVAASRPATVRILDLPAFLGPERLADQTLRTDGLHIKAEQTAELYANGLSDEIYSIYSDWWLQNKAVPASGG